MIDSLVFLIYLLGVNIASVLLFRFDKSLSQNGGRRVPEKYLLSVALIGGSPGAFWARHMFRHKTRKQPFSAYLTLIAAAQIVMGIYFVIDRNPLEIRSIF